jgi:hypothetical protein
MLSCDRKSNWIFFKNFKFYLILSFTIIFSPLHLIWKQTGEFYFSHAVYAIQTFHSTIEL